MQLNLRKIIPENLKSQLSSTISNTTQELMSNINLEKYLVCEFSMLLKDFSVKYGSASFFYRKLTKSNCSVGGRKNKDFFSKYFSGGFYTFFRVPTEIQIIILLKARKELTFPITDFPEFIRSFKSLAEEADL